MLAADFPFQRLHDSPRMRKLAFLARADSGDRKFCLDYRRARLAILAIPASARTGASDA